MKSLSIILPTHNRSAFLRRALKNVFSADIPNGFTVELIVVADACSDDTSRIVGEMRTKSPFPFEYHQINAGNVSDARNYGISQTQGEIILFLDDDVLVPTNWINEHCAMYKNQADIVGGKVVLHWDKTPKPDWFHHEHEILLSAVSLGEETKEVFSAKKIVGGNLSCRRAAFDALGGFNRSLGRCGTLGSANEDTDFVMRALKIGFRIFYTPTAVHHLVPPERVTPKHLLKTRYVDKRSYSKIDPRMSFTHALRRMVSDPPRILTNLLTEQWFELTKNPEQKLKIGLRRCTLQGKFMGSIDRLCATVHQKK